MNEKLNHLKAYISYSQSRLSLLDTKCSIFIAIEAAFMAAITFIVDKVCLPFPQWKLLGYIVIAVNGVFSCVIMIHLLETIRPATRFFSLRTGLNWMKSQGIMWTEMKTLVAAEEFANKADCLTEKLIADDLKAVAYNHYCLIFTKYRAYRLAVFFIKIQVLVMGIVAILALFIL